jgi:DNA-directed RNA polymerase subunit H (RpoH/RPB5)
MDIEYEDRIDLDSIRTRAQKARQTCVQMLQDRGYQIDKTTLPIQTVLPTPDDLYIQANSDLKGLIAVFWSFEPTIGKNEARDLFTEMEKKSIKRAILVSLNDKLTDPTKQFLLEMMKTKKMLLERFSFGELQYNPIRHELIPQYRILSKNELNIFKEAYQLNNIQQIPFIRSSDIFVRYLGLFRNQVIQFKRHDNSITYRLVW